MKARLLQSGFDSFAEHELLEIHLFYSLPRRNTNELAHQLIERFGSLKGVMYAAPDELLSVKGIGENTVAMIKLYQETVKKCAQESNAPRRKFDSYEKVVDYANQLFVGSVCETMYGIFLDSSLYLLDSCCLATGSINESKPIIRTIVEKALNKKATSVVLVHNHPKGTSEPSNEDIDFTAAIEDALNLVSVDLIDHLVIGTDGYRKILGEHLKSEKSKPNKDLLRNMM